MKRILILQHNGGRLANQLWNYASLYAYCLERGYVCNNPSFFEYRSFFPQTHDTHIVSIIFSALSNLFSFRSHSLNRGVTKVLRSMYAIYVFVIRVLFSSCVVYAYDGEVSEIHYLPPHKDADIRIRAFERDAHWNTLYTYGWLFRNAELLKKFHTNIKKQFSPRNDIAQRIQTRMQTLRSQYVHCVGVHIRKGDYRTFKHGSLFFTETEIQPMLVQLLERFGWDRETTCFVVCSDEKVSIDVLGVSHYSYIPTNTSIEDLFTLASCDCIIGSDSTFGAFASYYGDIPYIIFQKDGIVWERYQATQGYSETNYSLTCPQ